MLYPSTPALRECASSSPVLAERITQCRHRQKRQRSILAACSQYVLHLLCLCKAAHAAVPALRPVQDACCRHLKRYRHGLPPILRLIRRAVR
jgi:hypothetical protein